MPLHDMTISASLWVNRKVHDDKARYHGDQPHQDSPHIIPRKLLTALLLTIPDDHIYRVLLQVVQLVQLVEKYDELDDQLRDQVHLAHNTESLQAGQLKQVARLKRAFLDHGRPVDALNEEHW